jgi:hypothetical protein
MTGFEIHTDAALVQATADLLAARVALYDQQPDSNLIRLVDLSLEALMNPLALVELTRD